ncbi:hypothetical protein LK12_20340 [Novosphingobium malaysiense]|uniref:DUF559 domain-containing protein n=2 Tax=Novosphingobium malaysiense TaxID=1348853 RepID=A0A0B1ZKK3_9SPHN|nr:hypothetical protein LK12_20340 [Novosphingobium malaysiense]
MDRARKLRSEMSLPEGLLWRALRKHPDGLKFRRQHPSGAYILDFYCADARLAIEVDGMVHGMGDNPDRDDARDRWFASAGIATLRIPASAILDDLEAALALIVAEARARLPLHHPAMPGGPPPRDKLGEE